MTAHYRAVAATYEAAALRAEPPVKAIVEQFGTTQSTAARWVARCRERGLLAQTAPGKTQGRRHPRVLKVAEALDVPYEKLVDAIREHANGALRIS